MGIEDGHYGGAKEMWRGSIDERGWRVAMERTDVPDHSYAVFSLPAQNAIGNRGGPGCDRFLLTGRTLDREGSSEDEGDE